MAHHSLLPLGWESNLAGVRPRSQRWGFGPYLAISQSVWLEIYQLASQEPASGDIDFVCCSAAASSFDFCYLYCPLSPAQFGFDLLRSGADGNVSPESPRKRPRLPLARGPFASELRVLWPQGTCPLPGGPRVPSRSDARAPRLTDSAAGSVVRASPGTVTLSRLPKVSLTGRCGCQNTLVREDAAVLRAL